MSRNMMSYLDSRKIMYSSIILARRGGANGRDSFTLNVLYYSLRTPVALCRS